MTEVAVHDVNDVKWDSLPSRVVLNIHWLPEPDFLAKLEGFHTLTMARHPLDTLISILHFAPYRPDTNRWLLGMGGTEDAIRGKGPTAPEFRDYAAGPRTAALMSVSRSWWDQAGVIGVRYEDMLADGNGTVAKIVSRIGVPTVRPVEEAVAACAIDTLRTKARHYLHHMWKAQPGHWRELITAPVAHAVASAHHEYFAKFGYTCEPNESLSDAQAEANWLAADAETNRRDSDQLWTVIEATRAAAAETQGRLRTAEARCQALQTEATNARQECERLQQLTGAATEAHNRRLESERQSEQGRSELANVRFEAENATRQLADLLSRIGVMESDRRQLLIRLNEVTTHCQQAEEQLRGISPKALAFARRVSRIAATLPFGTSRSIKGPGQHADRRAA